MLKNKGLTGLGAIPFVTFKSLTQRLEIGGDAESIETLTVPPFGTEVFSPLTAREPALTPSIWSHRSCEPELFPAPKLTGVYRFSQVDGFGNLFQGLQSFPAFPKLTGLYRLYRWGAFQLRS